MDLTFKELFTKAGINNPSTAQFQRDKFLEYFNYSGEGRSRRYNEVDVQILAIISNMYAESRSYAEIKEALELKFGEPHNWIAKEQSNSTETSQSNVSEAIRAVIREEVSRLEQKIDDLILDSQQKESKAKVRDELLIAAIRSIQSYLEDK